ncbi:MAG: hypothetical protein IT270_10460 [Saprospiraceae bacterium]|nr:hypothetical protein [Saprospiraceae bacterium]
MAEQKEGDDFITDLRSLLQQYAELNTMLLREGPKMMAGLLSGDDRSANLRRFNDDVLRPLTSEWLKLSRRQVEGMLELGKAATQRFSHMAHSPQNDSAPQSAPAKRAEVRLAGQAGETVQASFQLNSSNHTPQSGQFACTPFFNENNGETPGFAPVFSPTLFTIQPGSGLSVEISADLPPDLPRGSYRATVVVLGFEQTSFDVALVVDNPPEAAAPPSKRTTKKS